MRLCLSLLAAPLGLALLCGSLVAAADRPLGFSYRRTYSAGSAGGAPSLNSDLRPPAPARRWLSDYEAQILAGAPIAQADSPRNFGAIDGAGGAPDEFDAPSANGIAAAERGATVIDESAGNTPRVDTTLYRGYFNPSFIGYRRYASYGGYGYGGFPYGWTDYPPWLYRPRYFYPYRYYPLRTGFSVYNPNFYYNNTWYGGYANPFWSGYGGFGFPYHFGGLGQYRGSALGGSAFVQPYSFGGFGYPYSYGVYGYPAIGLYRSVYNYTPSYAYFLYPGLGGLYVPPGYVGFPGYYGYMGYGLSAGSVPYRGGFYW